jgi:membrane-bound lytic murein transglycosylase D
LDGIAAAMHAHPSDIARTNGLKMDDGVDMGDELVIPIAGAVASAGPQRYVVRRGDTLVTVADRFGVSVEELRRWNHLSSNVVKQGSSLAVVAPVKLAPVTHVRSKASRSKKSSHVAAVPVHADSSHASGKHTLSKSNPSSTATRKNPPTAKEKSTSKTK